MPTPVPFDKYDSMGAYHWLEADPASRHYNPPLQARYGIVLKRARLAASGRRSVLDVGCGDGYLMSRLSPLFGQVTGVDSEARGVELARRQLASFHNCSIMRASAYHLPFPPASFDLVTCTDVIEHLNSPEPALMEIKRVLQPDGELVLTTPQWRADRKWDERHYREYRPEELKALLEPAFSAIELRYFWPMFWSRLYATRIGWHLIPYFSRWLFNPFSSEGKDSHQFGQLLAVCRQGGREA